MDWVFITASSSAIDDSQKGLPNEPEEGASYFLDYEGLVKAFQLANGYEEITWSDLKEARDNSKLIPGRQYRITDYQCTTAQIGTTSAEHQFDIIVTADSKDTLSEEARAALHSGDTYFKDNNLNAWKIWYCLDNDITRFGWADTTNGKGVIYRMIDEFNNDCPYDFKNIRYVGNIIDGSNSVCKKFVQDTGFMSDSTLIFSNYSCYTFNSNVVSERNIGDGTVGNSQYINGSAANSTTEREVSKYTGTTKTPSYCNNKISASASADYCKNITSGVSTSAFALPCVVITESTDTPVRNVNIGSGNSFIFGYNCSGLTTGHDCHNIYVTGENKTVAAGTTDSTVDS